MKIAIILTALACVLMAQEKAQEAKPQDQKVQQNAPERPRVFVTDSQSWQVVGNRNHTSGGAAPQTAEIYKTFGESCPNVIMTNIRDKADFVVSLDHEGGKGYLRKDNKITVFAKDGDMIFSKSTRTLGGGVKDACLAIAAHR